jgi:hypothetical protein
MRALGFRAEPERVSWAVVEGHLDAPVLVAADDFEAPRHQTEEAQSLSWYRDRVRQLIEQYNPARAGVRFAEMIGRSKGDSLRRRSRLEGVLLEAVNSKSIPVFGGALNTISKHLGTKKAKHYLETDEVRGLDWTKYNKNTREAILVAVSALEH